MFQELANGGGLEPFPAIRIWLSRIEAHPRFVGMLRSPLPGIRARDKRKTMKRRLEPAAIKDSVITE